MGGDVTCMGSLQQDTTGVCICDLSNKKKIYAKKRSKHHDNDNMNLQKYIKVEG